MKLLRDKSLSTQLLILLEVATSRHSRLSTIAEKIGVTKQAVSEYIKKMREEGLIHTVNGEYRATMQGVQLLHSRLLELKKFLDDNMQKLEIIEKSSAIAGDGIKKGQMVGLFMENGNLVAYSGRSSPSTAIATSDAVRGEDVPLKNMEGIVEHDIGKIYLIELPSPDDGGTRALETGKLKSAIDKIKPDRIGFDGPVAKAALEKIGMKGDFEFAPGRASVDAAQRGLDIAFLGCGEGIKSALSEIEEFNSSSVERIYYEVISFCHKNIKKRDE